MTRGLIADDLVLGLILVLPAALGLALYRFFAKPKGRSPAPKWTRIIAGNGLVFLLLVSISILGGECYCRFVCDQSDSFSLTRTSERWFDRHFQNNNLGFRDNQNYAAKSEPGKTRISFLGDSFTAGQGIENVGDRFVNLIRRQHPDWDVQALAQCGAETDEEIACLRELISLRYAIDWVVLVYCLNDLSDLLPEWESTCRRIFAPPKYGFWIRHSYFLNLVYYRIRAARDPDLSKYYLFTLRGYQGAVWTAQKERLRRLKELVAAQGGKLLVVTFPFLDQLGPNYAFRDVHTQLNEFWRSIGVANLDLYPLFSACQPRWLTVNGYDAHPNELAHRLAARAIVQFLEHQGVGAAHQASSKRVPSGAGAP